MKKLLYVVLVVILAALCISVLFLRSSSARTEHDNQVRQLELLYAEIQKDCNNGDYESAMTKANQLSYTAGYSEEIKTQWDNTRKATIDYIENAMLGLAY
jgi:outer membrane protein assembly factor BamD (BamD/ComL family)